MSILKALQNELDGYIRRGMDDRAKQVAEQLAAFGCVVTLSTKSTPIVPTESGTPKPQKKAAKIVSRRAKEETFLDFPKTTKLGPRKETKK